MPDIVELPDQQPGGDERRSGTTRSKLLGDQQAEIIIFPGVRYERMKEDAKTQSAS
ncbi:MAG: hypothetical protein OXR62_14210 [Ahrensia sp.]|nr:hypothetical protein [Ahrensia sp.]